MDASSVEFSLTAESFATGNAKRDEHVRSKDFLDAETHPSITLSSDTIATTDDSYRVTGTLQIASTSAAATFEIHSLTLEPESVKFRASALVDRRELGISKMPSFIIGNSIQVAVEGQAVLT